MRAKKLQSDKTSVRSVSAAVANVLAVWDCNIAMQLLQRWDYVQIRHEEKPQKPTIWGELLFNGASTAKGH